VALVPAVHFPDIGSYISVQKSLTKSQAEFELDVVAAVEILDSDFARVSILPSFISNMVAATNAITSGDSNITTAFSDYHLSILTAELPSTETTISGVITDLFAAMVLAAETFKTGGNFATYYFDKFARLDIPVDVTGTVDDSLAD